MFKERILRVTADSSGIKGPINWPQYMNPKTNSTAMTECLLDQTLKKELNRNEP